MTNAPAVIEVALQLGSLIADEEKKPCSLYILRLDPPPGYMVEAESLVQWCGKGTGGGTWVSGGYIPFQNVDEIGIYQTVHYGQGVGRGGGGCDEN